ATPETVTVTVERPPPPRKPVQPPPPPPVVLPASLKTYDGNYFSSEYPPDWTLEAADEDKGSYYDTTFRDATNSDIVFGIDVTRDVGTSDPYALAQPVVATLKRQAGYRLLDYSPVRLRGRDALRWEFLVREGDLLLRKVDIFFADGQSNGFGVLTQAPAR